MGGLILDNILVFLFWYVRQRIIDYRTSDWPTALAHVDRAESVRSLYPHVVLTYTFAVDGQPFRGRYRKGFWREESANEYATALKDTGTIQVRYQRDAPAKSYLRDGDPLQAVVPR